jgi:hypothetical protein
MVLMSASCLEQTLEIETRLLAPTSRRGSPDNLSERGILAIGRKMGKGQFLSHEV